MQKVDLARIGEVRDVPERVAEAATQIAALIRNGKHVIVFTGAGISTSAKIPDFRGPNGVWTREAQGKAAPPCPPLAQALPTPTHMALREFARLGLVKFVVSQNIDGLHRRSGLDPALLAELHGNCFVEVCWACNKEYPRSFEIRGGVNGSGGACIECATRVPHFCHCTGRSCECGGALKDSIIHFSEQLPERALVDAFTHAEAADVCIVLGSSLTVTPAALVPRKVVDHHGKLAIVNLQRTSLDGRCAVRVGADCDTVMAAVAAQLGVAIPAFDPASDPCVALLGEDDVAAAAAPNSVLAADGKAPIVDRGGFVDPRRDCPHIASAAHMSESPLAIMAAAALVRAPCVDCGDKGERWFCCQCRQVGCSRYVKGHMAAHADATGHHLATSLADLNTWCYACDAYVVGGAVDAQHEVLHLAKHGVSAPSRH